MNRTRRFRPSHATVVAYLALFVALGGTTYAAAGLAVNSVGTAQLRNGAVTTAKLHNHAVTASKLDRSVASTYLDRCPSGLKQAPGSSLCYETATRPRVAWTTAMATCALHGLRLPDPAELAQVFNDQAAVEAYEWTSNLSDAGSGLGQYNAVALSQAATRTIVPENLTQADTVPFRCVTEVSN